MSDLPSNRAASLQSDEINRPEDAKHEELVAKVRHASYQTLAMLACRLGSVDDTNEHFKKVRKCQEKLIVKAGEKCSKTCAQIMRVLEEADAVQTSKTNPKGDA